MTTMVVRVENDANIRSIASAMRLLKGVAEVSVQNDKKFKRIQGLPYTNEERVMAVQKAEEEYIKGNYVTTDELRKKHPRL